MQLCHLFEFQLQKFQLRHQNELLKSLSPLIHLYNHGHDLAFHSHLARSHIYLIDTWQDLR